MPGPDIVRLNSTILSWNSCRFAVNLVPFTGIVGCDFEDKRDGELVWGAKRDGVPLGMTSGKYNPSPMTLAMLRDSGMKLMELLTPLGLGSYGDAEFAFFMQAFEPVLLGPDPITVVMTGCRVRGVKDANQEGTGALTTEFTIQPLEITRNGMALFSRVRVIP